MKFPFGLFQRRAPTPRAGRISSPPWVGYGGYSALSPNRGINYDVLTELRNASTPHDQLNILRKRHADTSQAVWNFLRLANEGHVMEIRGPRGRLPRAEKRWNELAARINQISHTGLDGLVDQLHLSALTKGAMAVEVELTEDLQDIEEVWVLDPDTIEWRKEARKTYGPAAIRSGQKDAQGNEIVLIPYQVNRGTVGVSLEYANFFWVPLDPDLEDPRGESPLLPTIAVADFQLQILGDLQKVLHNQGWPRYDISILRESLLAMAPPEVKTDSEKLTAFLNYWLNYVKGLYNSLEPDDSFIHFDDTTVNMNQGANASRSLDVRAVTEGVDTQLLSAFKNMAVFMNRNAGVTETWGTVQFRIFAQGIRSLQRGSKRMIEQIASLALRVWGIQGTPTLTFNQIENDSEKQRLENAQQKANLWSFYVEKGWATPDEAANECVGHAARGNPAQQESPPSGG